MATTYQDLLDEVAAEKTVDEGLLTLVNNLIVNQNDPQKLDAILKGMKANIAPLQAALVANTPAAPAQVAPPPADTTPQPAAVPPSAGTDTQAAGSAGASAGTATPPSTPPTS